MPNNLITKLTEIQSQGKMSDAVMAERLGCSRQLWQMTRSGKIPPRITILGCICDGFPELWMDVIYFLIQGGKNAKTKGCCSNAEK